MTYAFIQSFQSEWLKKRHTAAAWLILICSLFMPVIVLFMRLLSPQTTFEENGLKHFWQMIHFRNWAAMGMFLLPLVLILFTSLITNLEFKNNAWKQLHATPQKFSTIFLAKLAVVLVMVLQLFILFNIGIYLTAMLPTLVFRGVPFPTEPFPLLNYLRSSLYFLIDCLPIVALQYLLSLRFKNFLVPIGVGFSLLVLSLLALNWKYGYILPYIYLPLNFEENQNFVDQHINRHWCAAGYFTLITLCSYLFYITKKDKS